MQFSLPTRARTFLTFFPDNKPPVDGLLSLQGLETTNCSNIEPPIGYNMVEGINDKIKQVLEENIPKHKPQSTSAIPSVSTTTTTTVRRRHKPCCVEQDTISKPCSKRRSNRLRQCKTRDRCLQIN